MFVTLFNLRACSCRLGNCGVKGIAVHVTVPRMGKHCATIRFVTHVQTDSNQGMCPDSVVRLVMS